MRWPTRFCWRLWGFWLELGRCCEALGWGRSAFAHRLGHGFGEGFGEVAEDGSFHGFDFDAGRHPGSDLYVVGFAAFEFAFGEFDSDFVVGHWALFGFFGDDVWADVVDLASHGPEDAVVVGIEFDAGTLAKAHESDVCRGDFGFGYEVFAQRQEFHEGVAWPQYAAYGGHFDVVDDGIHGRCEFGMFQQLGAVSELFGLGAELFLCLGHFGLGVLEVFVLFVDDLRFDVSDRSFQPQDFGSADVSGGFELAVDAQFVFCQ